MKEALVRKLHVHAWSYSKIYYWNLSKINLALLGGDRLPYKKNGGVLSRVCINSSNTHTTGPRYPSYLKFWLQSQKNARQNRGCVNRLPKKLHLAISQANSRIHLSDNFLCMLSLYSRNQSFNGQDFLSIPFTNLLLLKPHFNSLLCSLINTTMYLLAEVALIFSR